MMMMVIFNLGHMADLNRNSSAVQIGKQVHEPLEEGISFILYQVVARITKHWSC